ncbi:glycoside hydrolase family 3 protein [Paenibacillus macerans]|uniref:Carbohydrate binding module family protein n=3 Tax=Paenibacillus macerans TaxID=44252 RepID=A0A090ZFL7_PAEMA|nr:glycoside hydrolase family 3 protein [Paenibacillus macerans]KFN10074.1 carbohydrate binding module family protein [Paenibacillus macerans]MCY7561011.1 glycoside hydrolase family 3 C-terminal domain-containing protein [Paenibacillus macerans]SUD26947.1 glycoside hydrolase family protein [Paenibacillus macerans]
MSYPYQNPDLPLMERVNDLISRFMLEEKIELMCQYQTDIPRLGVNKYKHGTEGAHGVAWLGEATVFPQNTGLACTWNPELLQKIGSVIGDEARVYYQRDPAANGLTIWAPTVDMERDPRWGRTEEAYGEDPHLTGALTTGLVKGMQGDHPFYYKAVSTLKHFYGNNNEVDRGSASVSIDPRNKREYYLKAFEPAFRDGRAGSMMTAYNGINGTPCNFNHEVNEIVKGEWGMDGFVVGDAGDVLGTVMDHHYVDSYAEAVAGSIKAGIDSITDDQPISQQALRDALQQGLLTEADLDHALSNTFRVRFRLGEFDPAERNPYSHVAESKLCAPEHAALALEAARESVVLLKNDRLLPLGKDAASVAVIGPLADEAFTDWYSGTPPYRITPLQGVTEKMNGRPVHFTTGLDRIRLRSAATGKYVGIAAGEEGGAALAANCEDAEQAEVFERNDWGWGQITLRALSNGKFVTESESGRLEATADEARGWFVKEAFGFETQADGSMRMLSWEGKPVSVDVRGYMNVEADQEKGAGEAEGAVMVGAGATVDAEAAVSGGANFANRGAAAGIHDGFIVEVVQGGLQQAAAAAKNAETAIVFVGNSPFINGKETTDRPDITLPPSQQALIQAVKAVNPRTVVVIVGGYPFAVNWEQEHIPAIVFTSHAGQELGRAVADVLFGGYNPAGRLNMTWYKSADQLPDIMDYDIIKGKRTYQYFDGEVLYPFGHGLSYTTFGYEGLSLSPAEIGQDGTVTVSVNVRNTGELDGDEVVQLYVRAEASCVPRPLKTLKGFKRIHLKAGEFKTVTLELKASELAFWDVTRERYCVETGAYTIMVGPSSEKIAAAATLRVNGETVPPRLLRESVKAVNYDNYDRVFIDECREGGESIRTVQDSGGWIAFHDVDFGTGASEFEARVSGHLKGGEIVVTLGSPDGETAGTCRVLPTGGRQAWTTVTAPVTGAAGRRDVYLHLKGEVQISRFSIR